MTESIKIWLRDEQSTISTSESLARSLYSCPVTILLSGPLGAGKTTFVRGLGRSLGIEGPITSPTFALEQRYRTHAGVSFTHMDCYRLSRDDALKHLHASEEHGGIRCIEWSERLPASIIDEPSIVVALEEKDGGRNVEMTFRDIALPRSDDIARWRRTVSLPKNVLQHCDAVGAFASKLAHTLTTYGTVCRPNTLLMAGMLHDLFRFIDFRDGAGPPGEIPSPEDIATWQQWKQRWPGLRHETACARFLIDEGYPALASIVAVHGLTLPAPERSTIEQQLLFYADKRVRGNQVVTLEERFDDFRKRYSNNADSDLSRVWYEEAKRVEDALFPEGAPAS